MRLLLLTSMLAMLEWGQVRSEDDYHSKLPQTLYFKPGCNATKMWILQTSPMISKDYINKFKRFDELRDLLTRYNREMSTNSSTNTSCEEDLRWNSNDIDKYAVNQTYEENRNFAKLYQSNFPQLLPENYNNTYYKFAHTKYYKHTEASLRAFTEGLFDKSTVPASEDMEYLTELLHPCEQFKNNYIQEEIDFVRYSDRTSKDIAERLEYSKLTKEDIDMIFNICILQRVFNPKACNWCFALRKKDYLSIPFAKSFRLGYGFDRVAHLDCRLVKDIVSILNSTESPHVVAYFTNLPIFYLFTVFGFNAKLKFDMRSENVSDSFTKNFLVVKYNCLAKAEREKEKIGLFFNEQLVEFNICKSEFCNWWDILEYLKNTLETNCDELHCLPKKNAGERIAPFLVTILLTVIVRQLVF